jgi:hypothetical protein
MWEKRIRKIAAVMILLGVVPGIAACSLFSPYKQKSDVVLTPYEDYEMSMTAKVIGKREIELTIDCGGGGDFVFDRNEYVLEYKFGNTWYQVPLYEDYSVVSRTRQRELNVVITVTDPDILPDPNLDNRKLAYTVNLDRKTEKLPKGHYRIIVYMYFGGFNYDGISEWPDVCVLAAEFDLERDNRKH